MPRLGLILSFCVLGWSCTVTTETPYGTAAKEQGASRPTEQRPPQPATANPEVPATEAESASAKPATSMLAPTASEVQPKVELVAPGRDPQTALRWTAKPGSE